LAQCQYFLDDSRIRWFILRCYGLEYFNITPFGFLCRSSLLSPNILAAIANTLWVRYSLMFGYVSTSTIWFLYKRAEQFKCWSLMYCLDQFSWQMKDELKPQKAKFKSACIKLVFAFSLYQNVCGLLALVENLHADG
jgi:hypothetical protein